MIYTYTQDKSKIIYTTSVGQFMSFMKNLGFQFFKRIRNVLVLVQIKLNPRSGSALVLEKNQFRLQFWISDAVSVLGNPV